MYKNKPAIKNENIKVSVFVVALNIFRQKSTIFTKHIQLLFLLLLQLSLLQLQHQIIVHGILLGLMRVKRMLIDSGRLGGSQSGFVLLLRMT